MKDESLIEVKETVNNETKENNSNPWVVKVEKENFATEIFREFKVHSRIATIGLIALLAASSIAWAVIYYHNDKEWRDLFNSYDYISQDGEGINNVNSGSQGSLNNGSEE